MVHVIAIENTKKKQKIGLLLLKCKQDFPQI